MSRRVAWRCDREQPAEGVIGPGLRVGGIYLKAHMSVDGTKRTCRLHRAMSALRGKAENICSQGAFPVLTQTGPQRQAALRFIFTKSLFVRLQTQPFFPRLKSCGSAAGPI